MAALPSLRRTFKQALQAGEHDQLNGRRLRERIQQIEGWTCSDQEWAAGGLKERAVEEWQELMEKHYTNTLSSSPPPHKKRKKSVEPPSNDAKASTTQERENKERGKGNTKYDKVGKKNFEIFMGALGGLEGAFVEAFTGGDEAEAGEAEPSSDLEFLDPATIPEYGDEDEEEDVGHTVAAAGSSDLEISTPEPPPEPEPKQQKKKKPIATKPKPKASTSSSTSALTSTNAARTKTENSRKKTKKKDVVQYKSAEYVAESDDSSNDLEPSRPMEGGLAGGRGKSPSRGAGEHGGEKKKPRKRKSDEAEEGKGGRKKATKDNSERKPPKAKEGDAPKGTAEEEERIVKLKALLTAASSPCPFTASTGAARTLPVSRRIEILENLLSSVGLPIGKGGKLPTRARAKEVGIKRELEKETKDLVNNPSTSGLRDGKQNVMLLSLSESEDEDDSGQPSAKKKKKKKPEVVATERKKFGAFLGDQGSDESV
ncbi:hypothetical protein JCM11641_005190 [Rhodosporidiobolus odoratus]